MEQKGIKYTQQARDLEAEAVLVGDDSKFWERSWMPKALMPVLPMHLANQLMSAPAENPKALNTSQYHTHSSASTVNCGIHYRFPVFQWVY